MEIDLNNLRIITENNLNIELPDFTYDQNDTFVNEIKYNLIEMNNFKQKEKIKIIFSDLPQATIFDKSKNYIQNFDRGWGMFVLFFIIPDTYSGLDTILTPIVVGLLFIIISIKTQHISKPKFDMIDYIPNENDIIKGAY